MRANRSILTKIFKESLIPICCCLILGLALYQGVLFKSKLPSFRIILDSVIGSAFFLMLRVDKRNAFAVLLVLCVVEIGLLAGPLHVSILLTWLIFDLGMAISLFVFFSGFYRKTVRLRYLHPLVLATLVALFSALASVIVILMEGYYQRVEFRRLLDSIEINSVNGFLIGLGIGLGIFLLDNGILKKIEHLFSAGRDALKDGFQQFEKNL